jgi:Mrp family chromosome partitioning ATPase
MRKTISVKNAPHIYGGIVERLKALPPQAAHSEHNGSDWSEPADTNILIASAARRDGRTTTALGLALATAIAKPRQRVLLVDLDQRTGGLQRLLGRHRSSKAAGIVDIIQGRADITRAVQSTSLPNLHFLGCGTQSLNVPEDCQSEALLHVLADIRARYDYAYFDSPALGEHVEGRLLSEVMDRVVLVIRSDRSHKEDVLAARRQLPEGKLVGAVVNDCRQPVPSLLARHL